MCWTYACCLLHLRIFLMMIKTLILLAKICEVQFSYELKDILVQALRPQQMIERVDYVICVVPMVNCL